MSKINVHLLFISALFIMTSACSKKNNETHWKRSDGYVPNAATAIKIAEAVLPNIYGEQVNDKKPFRATLVDGSIWVINGTLSSNLDGGVPHIEIQKSDGRIIKIIHGK